VLGTIVIDLRLHSDRRCPLRQQSPTAKKHLRVACGALGVVALATLCIPVLVLGQTREESPRRIIGPGDIASVAGAAILFAVPKLTEINSDPVRCAPCDRSSVPFFDRWVIAPMRPVAGRASDILHVSLWAVTWLELVNDGPVGHAGIVASLESTLWAAGTVQLAKVLTGRKRPVLYTDSGIEVAHVVSNQRSWPSGHSATAAALATSYCLTRRELSSDNSPGWRCWLAMAGAVGVGVLRMAAAKHYPSDVLAGLAAGTAAAFVVHTVKF